MASDDINYDFFENETRKHQQMVSKFLIRFSQLLLERAVTHDASKLEEPERGTFAKVTPLLKGLTFGSPEYKAQADEMGPALTHHYAHNRHHPEYFRENKSQHQDLGSPILCMNLVDIVEMVCDWIAATKRHNNGSIAKSIEVQKKRFDLSEQFCQWMRNTLSSIEDI